VQIAKARPASLQIELQRLALPAWAPKRAQADLHVHMNYGGHYKATAETLAHQARAEGLDAVYNLVVNKEERVPDIGSFGAAPQKLGGAWIIQGQEFHSSYWGHLACSTCTTISSRPISPRTRARRWRARGRTTARSRGWRTNRARWWATRILSTCRWIPTRTRA